MKKREFLKRLGQGALASPFLFTPVASAAAEGRMPAPYDFSNEEGFWKRIRQDYALLPTLNKFWEHIKEVNYQGSYYMRTVQWDNKKRIANRLAALVGCDGDELIITRNTTESLDLVIGGFPWQEGDEAIFAEQDYGAMQMHFQQIAARYGVVNKVISIPNHPKSDEKLVSLYEEQITSHTKLIMVCHMINITGQILPVRKICEMAHRHGVEVMVDGAHCIGHFQVDIASLDCDYYGSSLHKWLSTPLGAGLLYVRKTHIPKIWPLLAEHKREPHDISRLNHTGTHPVHTDLAIDNAIDYLELIGMQRKEERMRFLQRYWSNALRDVEHVVINTPVEPHRSCGIANVGITHIKPADLAKTLLEDFNIFTVAIDYANVQGCRITPNVYTTTEELDRFISVMKELASRS